MAATETYMTITDLIKVAHDKGYNPSKTTNRGSLRLATCPICGGHRKSCVHFTKITGATKGKPKYLWRCHVCGNGWKDNGSKK